MSRGLLFIKAEGPSVRRSIVQGSEGLNTWRIESLTRLLLAFERLRALRLSLKDYFPNRNGQYTKELGWIALNWKRINSYSTSTERLPSSSHSPLSWPVIVMVKAVISDPWSSSLMSCNSHNPLFILFIFSHCVWLISYPGNRLEHTHTIKILKKKTYWSNWVILTHTLTAYTPKIEIIN